MDGKIIGEEMYSKACEFLDNRFPSGWGGCAIMRTADGRFLISVALENFNSGAWLCMETGAMCEAQKYNLKITYSMCVTRSNEKEKPKILTACGICQERLMYWGNSVKVAVTNQFFSRKIRKNTNRLRRIFINENRTRCHIIP